MVRFLACSTLVTCGCAFDPSGLPGEPDEPGSLPAADAAAAVDAPPPVDAAVAPPGYDEVPGRVERYRRVAPGTLYDAVADCAADGPGAAVVVIDDAGENAAIQAHVRAALGGARIWLGIRDDAREGAWTTISGARAPFLNWRPGEPNDWRDEDCAVMLGEYDPPPARGQWNDTACDGTYPTLCEWRPPAP